MLVDPPRRHHHARRAGAALRRAAPLERLERTGIERLDRPHAAIADLIRRDEARVHGQSVEVDGAGAALALAAALLRAGQPQPIAERVQQAVGRIHVNRNLLPIQSERDGEFVHSALRIPNSALSINSINLSAVSGITRGSAPVAAATAFTIAGAGPSIGSSPKPLAPPAPCG